MIYRITYEFEGFGIGWSETHAAKSSEQNPRLLQAAVAQVAQKRAEFLGFPFSIKAVRIAKYYDEATLTRARGTFLLKQKITPQDPTLVGSAEPGNVALIMRGFTLQTDPDTVIYNGNQNTTWAGGPPDGAVVRGGEVRLANNGLGAAYRSWEAAMVSTTQAGVTVQHGWLAAARVVDTKITSIMQNDDGTVRIVTADNIIPPLAVNQPGHVRIRRVNTGRSPMNRALIVYPVNATSADTYEVIGIPTPQIGGRLRAYRTLPVFLNYAGLIMELTTGKHKRGRVPGSTPGRLPTIIRG